MARDTYEPDVPVPGRHTPHHAVYGRVECVGVGARVYGTYEFPEERQMTTRLGLVPESPFSAVYLSSRALNWVTMSYVSGWFRVLSMVLELFLSCASSNSRDTESTLNPATPLSSQKFITPCKQFKMPRGLSGNHIILMGLSHLALYRRLLYMAVMAVGTPGLWKGSPRPAPRRRKTTPPHSIVLILASGGAIWPDSWLKPVHDKMVRRDASASPLQFSVLRLKMLQNPLKLLRFCLFLSITPCPMCWDVAYRVYSIIYTVHSRPADMLDAEVALHSLLRSNKYTRAAVAERLARSPPTQGDPGPIPGRVTGFSHVGIVPDVAVGRRVSSGISHSPRSLIAVPLHAHLERPHPL
ncbi:hypothetical protein PR048_029325 [Dryococelus australis]|uniref:Uncharacterized protein n=1 Tax=Dryococelus australis TaxID=614101 RepID=A0ABQ9GD17_9NEOP|nr:hypothetical protein PR048_029325 [Dryococelus australis]